MEKEQKIGAVCIGITFFVLMVTVIDITAWEKPPLAIAVWFLALWILGIFAIVGVLLHCVEYARYGEIISNMKALGGTVIIFTVFSLLPRILSVFQGVEYAMRTM